MQWSILDGRHHVHNQNLGTISRVFIGLIFFLIGLLAFELGAKPSQAAEESKARRIVVYGGIPRSDGWGDVAASIQVARQLKRSDPDLEVVVVWDEQAHQIYGDRSFFTTGQEDAVPPLKEIYKVLIPKFRVYSKFKDVDQVRYQSLRVHGVPRADLYLGLSIGAQEAAYVFKVFNPKGPGISLVYDEPRRHPSFSDYELELDDFFFRGQGYRVSSETSHIEAYFEAGLGDRSMGFYLSANEPSVSFSKEKALRKALLGSRGFRNKLSGVGKLPENVALGFSYVQGHNPETAKRETEIYLKAVSHLAEHHPKYQDRPVVIVTRPIPNLEVPKNVKVIQLPRASLYLHESLIAHSDMAVQVTGDSSVAMALDHKKPFILDGGSWKAGVAGRLFDHYLSREDALKHSSIPMDDFRAVFRPRNATHDVFKDPSRLAAILSSEDYQRALGGLLYKNRFRWSIPSRILAYLKYAETARKTSGTAFTASDFKAVVDAVHQHSTHQSLLQFLKKSPPLDQVRGCEGTLKGKLEES